MSGSTSTTRPPSAATPTGWWRWETSKTLEGEEHPDRDAQFRYINAAVDAFHSRGQPVISVDTKKKELVGEFHNNGCEWQPVGAPVLTSTHDFPGDAIGKAVPYGVYDIGANQAWVSVGIDHDTPMFAVNSIRTWWKQMGAALPKRNRDSRHSRCGRQQWLSVANLESGTSKARDRTGDRDQRGSVPARNRQVEQVEHRLFSHITMNWRGHPLEDFETVVQLIGSTKIRTGLKVRARLDKRLYATGVQVADSVINNLSLTRAAFHGEWNYMLS